MSILFIVLNTISSLICLALSVFLLINTFPLEEIEYEDNILMLLYALLALMLFLSTILNFYYFAKKREADAWVKIVPVGTLTCSLLFLVISLLTQSSDILTSFAMVFFSSLFVLNVVVLQRLNLTRNRDFDPTVFE